MSDGRLADAKVAEWVLAKFKAEAVTVSEKHLAACPGTTVTHVQGGEGSYGCDTGCEYVRLEARVSCPHHREDYKYGEFGDLADLLGEIFGE
jgi:hypothetical protein